MVKVSHGNAEDESELIRSSVEGDMNAFGELVNRYRRWWPET